MTYCCGEEICEYKEIVEKTVEYVQLTKKHYEKESDENPILPDEYLDYIRFCNVLLKELLATKEDRN